MNLKKLGRTFWVIAAVAILAMVLQGCGGDDDDGISKSMHDQVVMERDELQEELADLQDMLDAANADVTRLEGELADAQGDNSDLMAELQDAKDEAARLQMMVDDAAAAEAMAAANEMANAYFTGIMAGNAGTAPTPMISAGSDGMLMAEIDDYMMVADFAEADAIDGFRGVMLTGSDMVVYTDIADAEDTPLGMKYNSMANPGEASSYPIASGETNDIMWADVTRDADAHRESSETEDGTTTITREFDGEVSGVPGTFSCSGTTACPVPTRQSNGKVVNDAGEVQGTPGTDWAFIPTDPDAKVDVADDQYLYFGWWVMQTSGAGEALAYDVETFAAGMGFDQTVASGAGTAVTGSATYTGGAAGKYAMKSLLEDVTTGGHWTASAELTANFDADSDPDVDGNDENGVMVSGMITDFMTGDTAQAWTVKLMADGDLTADGIQPADDLSEVIDGTAGRRTTEWDFGGSVKAAGSWTPTFHGADAALTADTDLPMAVTGTFDAMVSGLAQISGGFAASAPMDDDN